MSAPSPVFQAELPAASAGPVVAAPRRQPPASLWRLNDNESALQKSENGGTAWQTIRLNTQSALYALAATGPVVWVGGADGTLFHSVDNGVHWTRISVRFAGERLTSAITQIESHDPQTVLLRTASGERWITTDGGLHWRAFSAR